MAHAQLLIFFRNFIRIFSTESYWAYKVLWIEKLPKHALTRRTRVVPVCYVNDLQIMGLWEIFKLKLSLQATVLFRMSWVAMRLGTLQCTLGRGSNTSIEIITAGRYNQSQWHIFLSFFSFNKKQNKKNTQKTILKL